MFLPVRVVRREGPPMDPRAAPLCPQGLPGALLGRATARGRVMVNLQFSLGTALFSSCSLIFTMIMHIHCCSKCPSAKSVTRVPTDLNCPGHTLGTTTCDEFTLCVSYTPGRSEQSALCWWVWDHRRTGPEADGWQVLAEEGFLSWIESKKQTPIIYPLEGNWSMWRWINCDQLGVFHRSMGSKN